MTDQEKTIVRKVTLAEKLVQDLAAENYPAVTQCFDSTLRQALPAAVLEQAWKSLQQESGSFQQAVGTRMEQTGPFSCVFVTCDFTGVSIDVKVVISPDNQVVGLFFLRVPPPYETPSYVDPHAFDEVSVTVGTAPWALPGTLSVPKGEGPCTAVILVHGSGPHDRDETVGANKPFRDLAGGLASRGIAVLRYDKRTYAYSDALEQVGKNFTVNEEVVDDALAAVALLREQPRLSAARIFVLGHSMGGMLIPRIGQRAPSVAGFIIMAGNTTPLEDLLAQQVKYLVALDGHVSEEEENSVAAITAQVETIKKLTHADTDSPDKLTWGPPPAYWLDLREYHPAQAARQLNRPVLVLQGERDYQVPMADFREWQSELTPQKKSTFIAYPGLNHLFMEGRGPSNPSEYLRAGHVAETVIADIVDWLQAQKTVPGHGPL